MTKPVRIYRAEVVVLKAYDYGEADRILTVYSPAQGKIRAIAKGVRRTKSRKSGHLDLFTRSTIMVAVGRQLDIVTQAETVENFAALRTDLWRLGCAAYVAELVDGFASEGLANPSLYALLVTTLRRLAAGSDSSLAVRAFEVQMLGIQGYRPQLHRCLHCDAAIEPRLNRFSARLGGVLCPLCEANDRLAPAISVSALKVLRNLQTNEEGMLQIAPLMEDVQREVETRLQEYISYRLEYRPKSAAFLERLRCETLSPPVS